MVIVCLVIYFCLVLLAHFDSQMVRSAVDVIIETDAGAGIMLTWFMKSGTKKSYVWVYVARQRYFCRFKVIPSFSNSAEVQLKIYTVV